MSYELDENAVNIYVFEKQLAARPDLKYKFTVAISNSTVKMKDKHAKKY